MEVTVTDWWWFCKVVVRRSAQLNNVKLKQERREFITRRENYEGLV